MALGGDMNVMQPKAKMAAEIRRPNFWEREARVEQANDPLGCSGGDRIHYLRQRTYQDCHVGQMYD